MKTIFALLTLTFLLPAASAGGDDGGIPVTTASPQARMDFVAGQAALDRGDGPEANALFRAAVAADPQFTYAWNNLGVASFSTEEFSTSLKRAADSAGKASEGERLLVQINQRFLDNDFDAQLQLAKQLVEKYPRSARAWMTLGNVEGNLTHFAEQRAAITKAIEADPSLAAAPFAMAISYLFNEPRDFAKAEKYFRDSIALAPGEDNYYWSLGDVFRATNRLEEAREYYERASLLDPHDGTALLKLGHVNSFLGRYDEARADYDRGIATAELANRPFYTSYKLFTWVHAGQAREAVDALEKLSVQTDSMGLPEDQRTGAQVFALTNAITVSLHAGLHEDTKRVLGELSNVLRAQAKVVGTDEFSRIQEAQIAYFDGQFAARRGDYKQAQQLAKRYAELVAAQQNPRKMENYHDLLGLNWLLQKKYAQAVAEYRQADMTNMYTRFHLALALEGAKQTAEARKVFREVAEFNFNTVGFALVRRDALARGS
jgi:tetratricopeptide (TPR) repeat protein